MQPQRQRSFSEPPEIAPDTQPDIAEPKVAMKKSRYSQLRQARQSSSLSSEATAAQAPDTSQEPEGRAKTTYSQRRSLRMSQQAQVPTADAEVAKSSGVGEEDQARAGGASSSSGHNSKPQMAPKLIASEGTDSAQFEQLRQEHEVLLNRLRNMEETFVRNLGAVQEDMNLQIETTEKRIYTRVLEELDIRLRQTLGMAPGKVACLDPPKPYGSKLSVDVSCSNEAAPQGVGTPVNEEPEQEYDTCDMSECSSIQASGSRKGFEPWKSPSTDESPPHRQSQKDRIAQEVKDRIAQEVSSAELADNRRRLQNIGNAARSITCSLGGNTAEPMARTLQAKQTPDFAAGLTFSTSKQSEYDGLQTPDFSAPSFAGSPLQMPAPSTPGDTSPDGLDAEMARLADLRRFASSVMKAAESQCAAQAPPNSGAKAPATWSDSTVGGRMSAGMFGTNTQQSGLRDTANHQDRLDPPSSSSSGRRRAVSVPNVPPHCPWEDNRQQRTPRGMELPAQPPPQPPPTQAEPLSSQPWPSAMRNGGRARRSAAQPLHVPWPGGNAAWEGSVENEGRLVF